MGISRSQLEADLAPIVGPILAPQLVNSYVEMQQRYTSGDWKPAELDGGHFCEAVARAVYRVDSGNDSTELPGKICEYLRAPGTHALDKQARDHFCRVLQTVYKFRSDRGIAHISSTYTANYADATLVLTCVKWMFAEFLRLSWNNDRNRVAGIIETLTQFEHPLIHELDGKPLVLSSALSAPEEVLLLLSNSADGRLSRDDLKCCVKKSPTVVSTAITRLVSSREARASKSGDIVITPLGQDRVRKVVMPKLANGKTPRPRVRKRAN